MENLKIANYIKNVLQNMPEFWLTQTTHRLDIYSEKLAKTEFTQELETLFNNDNFKSSALNNLPTAFDYIRLGHPLSCLLEWTLSKLTNQSPKYIISFASNTIPILAILRKNLLINKNTQISYISKLPESFDTDIIRKIYGYNFELNKVNSTNDITEFNGTSIFISNQQKITDFDLPKEIDFYINFYHEIGSLLFVKKLTNEHYINDIQHVRRRETIAMTPANCIVALNSILNQISLKNKNIDNSINKQLVHNSILKITGSKVKPIVGSSGLSIQYAIVMGLIHEAKEKYNDKNIKIIVPTNCYGGTNDQARRIANCIDNVQVVDLVVDSGNDMVESIDDTLEEIALNDAIPYIITEIPTNPRVEVPNMDKLCEVLNKKRNTKKGQYAVEPVFILDQTFCPNIRFAEDTGLLSNVKTISYVSGSKFPSGGQCTAGYCVTNQKAEKLMVKINSHLKLCDNEATPLQYKILAKQLPSMNHRINAAYNNTRRFVNIIKNELPKAKINFVSEQLARKSFTPSVFSIDLPTKGKSKEERELYKRSLNLKLINLMIREIPEESKFCVSYGQLEGCYWTVPASSTQGTTKESDKDYIVRVSVSPNIDIDLHKNIFRKFVQEHIRD
jgi:cystathionine beta-lyase/cystathionine gamma-synthase